MRIPYGFTLTSSGTLEINRSEANVVRMIFDFYMAGASLGKVVDMLHAKQISSPTGKAKWTRAAVDHLLSNGKYIAVIGMEKFMDAQFEKSARCNVDYDKEGTPRNQELWTTSTYFLYGGALQDDYRPGKEYIEPSTEALVSIMIPDIFPQDLLHVPPTDILRFREKRKDERNQFLNAIKTLRNELAQADAPEVIEAIINDEKKKIDSAANEYRKSMDILRVAKFGSILTTVITVAADVLGYCSNFPDLYKGAIESSGLWAGILTGIFEKRVGNINNPYTYLAQIKSTFSYYPGASKLFGGQPQIAKYNYTLYRGFEEFIND